MDYFIWGIIAMDIKAVNMEQTDLFVKSDYGYNH